MTGKSILDVQGPWGGLSFIGMVYRGFCAIFGFSVLPLLIVVTDSIYFVAWAGLLFADGRLYYIIQMQTRLHLRTSPSAVHPATHSRRGLQSPLDGPWY